MKIELINDLLVIKMHKTAKKALAIGLLGFVVLILLIVLLDKVAPFLATYSFFIGLGYIVLFFASYMLWLILTSKQKYKTITFDFNRFYLEGRAGNKEVKYDGLALIEIDEAYSPDLYISFIYNETIKYNFMIHKNSWPELAKFFDEHKLKYSIIGTENE